MQIEVASLAESGKDFDHQYQPGELSLEDERVHLLDPQPYVRGRIRMDRGRVKVAGKITGHLQLECDRCLKPVESAVAAKFSREYATGADYQAQHAVELSEDDLNLSVFDGAVIDIDLLVREELLLAAPDQVLCQQACQGICPTCGADRNAAVCDCETADADPRWAGLKELVNGK
ncbi:MAG: hypothetical protein QOF62_213 [Pyrinomonadaceae bacterium]|jgi:uncharacterized protein|nr:hypothetical protein [Pyrinomonadaceae bacterium]